MNTMLHHLYRTFGLARGYNDLQQAAEQLARQLQKLPSSPHTGDSVFQKQALFRLSDMQRRVGELSAGLLSFESTETWRTVYEDVLTSCTAKRYLSSALIRSDGYWRDAPGRCSLDFNYRLIQHGYFIHRVFLIDEFFWPPSMTAPAKDILQWIEMQHQRGIEVGLVRLTDLDDEPELVCDIGIYGEQAVGQQTTDLEGRTTRFEIWFSREKVAQAEQKWNQLLLYAVTLENLEKSRSPDGTST